MKTFFVLFSVLPIQNFEPRKESENNVTFFYLKQKTERKSIEPLGWLI
jgi:hypothetical protein